MAIEANQEDSRRRPGEAKWLFPRSAERTETLAAFRFGFLSTVLSTGHNECGDRLEAVRDSLAELRNEISEQAYDALWGILNDVEKPSVPT